jgi:stage V sporulation protein SpoVS
MYKLISASLFIMMLSACRSAPVINNAMAPQMLRANSVNNAQDAVKLVDGFTTVIDKQKVIQKLMNSEITISKADIYDKTNVFTIEFSKGRSNAVVGFLRMSLRPSGVSEIQMVGNFYKNQPVVLSAQESAQILKSAINYPVGSELAQILG